MKGVSETSDRLSLAEIIKSTKDRKAIYWIQLRSQLPNSLLWHVLVYAIQCTNPGTQAKQFPGTRFPSFHFLKPLLRVPLRQSVPGSWDWTDWIATFGLLRSTQADGLKDKGAQLGRMEIQYHHTRSSKKKQLLNLQECALMIAASTGQHVVQGRWRGARGRYGESSYLVVIKMKKIELNNGPFEVNVVGGSNDWTA